MIDSMRFSGIGRDDFLDASRWIDVIVEASLDRVGEISALYLCTPALIVRLRAHEMGASRWEYFVLECEAVKEIVRTQQEREVEFMGTTFPVTPLRFSTLASVDAFTGIRLVPHTVEISKSETREVEDELEITHPGGVYRVGINVVGCLTFRSESRATAT